MTPDPLIIIAGAITTALTAILTTVGKARGQRTDQIIQTLTEVRAWSDDLRESEEACRRELAEVRREVEHLRDEIEALRQQLRKG